MNVADHHIGNQHRKSYAETAAPPRWLKLYLLHFRRSDQLNSCYDNINGRRSYKNPFKDEQCNNISLKKEPTGVRNAIGRKRMKIYFSC